MDTTQTPEILENVNVLDEVHYDLWQANGWKRFGNWAIDRVVFYLLWRFGVINLFVWAILKFSIVIRERFVLYLVVYVTYIIADFIFIAGLETATGGKTIGKFLTQTRAMYDDGRKLTLKGATLRYLSRLVPFEPFSALGTPSYPWHDRWTKTVVIDENLTTIPPQDYWTK